MKRKNAPTALLMLALGLFISGICGCKHYVGVEWVNDYSAVGKGILSNRDDCAEGFYSAICAHPDWDGKFDRGDDHAWEEHFKRTSKGGTDDSWIDDVDIAYFAGHGAGDGTIAGPTGVGRGGGYTFGIDAHDDWVLSAIPTNREPRWGDGDLEWIVLDVCSALARLSDGDGVLYTICERWANSDVMHGLHYILGFRTLAHDDGDRGGYFGEYLTGAMNGTNYTVRCAWMMATQLTEDSDVEGAYLRAASEGSDTYCDHIYDCGWVSDDPDPAIQCYYYCSWPCIW
jgi:hypothetical protein